MEVLSKRYGSQNGMNYSLNLHKEFGWEASNIVKHSVDGDEFFDVAYVRNSDSVDMNRERSLLSTVKSYLKKAEDVPEEPVLEPEKTGKAFKILRMIFGFVALGILVLGMMAVAVTTLNTNAFSVLSLIYGIIAIVLIITPFFVLFLVFSGLYKSRSKDYEEQMKIYNADPEAYRSGALAEYNAKKAELANEEAAIRNRFATYYGNRNLSIDRFENYAGGLDRD